MQEAGKLTTIFYTHWYLVKKLFLYVLCISSDWPAWNYNMTSVNNKHCGTWIPIWMTWLTAHVECLLKTNSFFIKPSEDFFLFTYSISAILFLGCIWATETPNQFDHWTWWNYSKKGNSWHVENTDDFHLSNCKDTKYRKVQTYRPDVRIV